MRARHGWILALILLLALASLPACEKDDLICAPAVPAGRITGTVRTGGVPLTATIVAIQVTEDPSGGASFEDSVATDGHYALDLPAGDYILELRVGYNSGRYRYAQAGPSWGDLPVDTLRVGLASTPHVANFNLGGISFGADVPVVLEGQNLRLRLHPLEELDLPQFNGPVLDGSVRIEGTQVLLDIPGVLPGEYQISLEVGYRDYMCFCPYGGDHVWLPGTRERDASPWTTVRAGERVDLTCDVPATWANLTGSVTGAWQEMGLSQEPEITLVTPDSQLVMGRRRLVDGAEFNYPILWAEPVKVMVSDNGVEQWIGGATFADATVFDLVPGQTTTGADLVQNGLILDLAAVDFTIGSMVCRFRDPSTLTTVATWESPGYGEDRYVGITNLDAGDYLLEIVPSSWDAGRVQWRPQYFDRAAAAADAQIITIGGGGSIASLDLVLELGGQIRGTARPASGPSRSFYVLVTTDEDNDVWGYDYAWDWDSEFALTGLADGSYKIGAVGLGANWERPGPAPEGTVWYPGTTDWNAANVIDIQDAAVVESVVIEVP